MRIRTIACTTVFLCSSGLLFAQIPDANTQQQQNMQTQQQQSPSTSANMPGANDSVNNGSSIPGETGQKMQDKIFLRKASEDGFSEIQFGQLAQTKATDPEVKALAAKLAADHTDLNTQLQPFMELDGVMAVRKMDKKMKEQYDKLATLSGEDFDKEYLRIIFYDHLEDARTFRSEAIATNDAPLKAAVDKASLMMRQHLMESGKLAQAHGVEMPKRGPRPAGATPASMPPPPPHE